ncbi:conserved hypothetical protein [Cellulomonas flavigena DSM 20109]|uniref:NnrS family protein n=1 Tax=Cellulomonas flavigena (strain ATCC 482 / DSM 20109 / BCRC 11376 / JCM 18109 / NBRC 3775 / NCIMB 8073 / NRS 134) TaxID=446466 RepID=D5UEK4_CELFN|nr:conserved hypothetical protein [Cellulomonas flavigena DSM 20109]
MVLLVPAGIAMLAGLDAALLLLGLPAPVRLDRWAQVHGPLMVLGFVGTLVVLERAVAVRRRAALAAPAALGLGGLALLTPLPLVVGQAALVVGALGLGAVYVAVWRRQPATALAVQTLGAAHGVAAAVLWLAGTAVPHLVPCLAGFLVLTIAGERLELLRVGGHGEHVEDTVWALACGWALAATLALLWPAVGWHLLGAVLVSLVVVLVRHDVARRTVRATGLPRFMACAMLAGYAWLAAAGAVWLVAGPVLAGRAYDAVLHAVFLGFVLSMVMAHAPVILPAVLRRPLPYRPLMYVPLALLHVTLAVRVLVGDVRGLDVVVQAGGVGNVAALLLFVLVAAGSALRGPAPRPRTERRPVPDAAALEVGAVR